MTVRPLGSREKQGEKKEGRESSHKKLQRVIMKRTFGGRGKRREKRETENKEKPEVVQAKIQSCIKMHCVVQEEGSNN